MIQNGCLHIQNGCLLLTKFELTIRRSEHQYRHYIHHIHIIYIHKIYDTSIQSIVLCSFSMLGDQKMQYVCIRVHAY